MATFVAIDIQNVFFNAKKLKKRLNFQKLYDLLKTKDAITCNTYVATSPHTETSYLINTLESIGFNVRAQEQKKERKHLKFNSRSVGITIDAINNIEEFDTFVLVSMDEGVVDLLNYLRDNGKQVIIWALDTNETIQASADEFNVFDKEFYIKR